MKHQLKVKVCGLREPSNVEALANIPIDFAGFIFYQKSPRNVKGEQLADWLNVQEEKLEKLKRVGVFVNASLDFILNKVHDYKLDFVQLHGDESPEYCREIISFWDSSSVHRARLIKAFSVDDQFDFEQTKAYEAHCAYFLFDTKSVNYGGSGQQFNWSLLEQYHGLTPFFLSGGIDLDAAEAIKELNFERLYGVDVNSRFEMEPGLKDVEKVQAFVSQIKIEAE